MHSPVPAYTGPPCPLYDAVQAQLGGSRKFSAFLIKTGEDCFSPIRTAAQSQRAIKMEPVACAGETCHVPSPPKPPRNALDSGSGPRGAPSSHAYALASVHGPGQATNASSQTDQAAGLKNEPTTGPDRAVLINEVSQRLSPIREPRRDRDRDPRRARGSGSPGATVKDSRELDTESTAEVGQPHDYREPPNARDMVHKSPRDASPTKGSEGGAQRGGHEVPRKRVWGEIPQEGHGGVQTSGGSGLWGARDKLIRRRVEETPGAAQLHRADADLLRSLRDGILKKICPTGRACSQEPILCPKLHAEDYEVTVDVLPGLEGEVVRHVLNEQPGPEAGPEATVSWSKELGSIAEKYLRRRRAQVGVQEAKQAVKPREDDRSSTSGCGWGGGQDAFRKQMESGRRLP
jgi:hypothetical protein